MTSKTSAPVRADEPAPKLPGESVSSGPGLHRRAFVCLEVLAPYAGPWNELHRDLLRDWVARDERMTGLEPATQRFVVRRSSALRVALEGVALGVRPAVLDWETLYATADQAATGAIEDLFEHLAEPTPYVLHRLIQAATIQALLRELGRLSYAQGPAVPAQAPCEAGSHPPPATAATEEPSTTRPAGCGAASGSEQGAKASTAARTPTLPPVVPPLGGR